MSSSSHTPGPWTFRAFGSHGPSGPSAYRIYADDAISYIADLGDYSALDEANARLIAAAPDLLEALERVGASFVQEVDDREKDHLWYACTECEAWMVDDEPDQIRHESDCLAGIVMAAIKKARGE